jgi:site-specific DNA-methyltransferase (adenine-specific)
MENNKMENKNAIKYINGDIHEVIKTIDDNSIDFIYTDPPFGTTKAKWDKPLKWEELFKEMWRVLKPNGIICLYASIPFTYELLKYETPKYNYSWKKNNKTGFFQAKYQPLRQMEEIFIYYKKRGTYNPQMIGNEYHAKRNVKVGGRNGYYGEKLKDKDNTYDEKEGHTGRFPTTFKEWNIRKDNTGITRDDEQIDYFIKTYTNENDTILDMTCNSVFVGNRCKILKRNYIGVDLIKINGL